MRSLAGLALSAIILLANSGSLVCELKHKSALEICHVGKEFSCSKTYLEIRLRPVEVSAI